ncbi:hypothetical protein [Burkholderia ambifaria]|uniref:hypothetical protein n=1 Tax=Burkholderia ambifaria TaxID=152480 RepID=UPI00158F55A6|nr:hypothetical protein [Burkholderia ambifaria]
MTDREMLEWAAKAAQYSVRFTSDEQCFRVDKDWTGQWNPMTDDGDALRLAVDLNFLFKHALLCAVAEENDRCNGDYRAATRRAIVRVAAGIGMTEA